ncbi:hypothetical protein FRC01_001046 [Tulasnella sp. 417]|nr:hypothetical protein FRC01_001046 [Tulasnella sp. 417]
MTVDTGASSRNPELDRRRGYGIAVTKLNVNRESPSYITYKWTSMGRSPNKFTVWLVNVASRDYYMAVETVWTSDGKGIAPLDPLPHRAGEYQLVLTKHNFYGTVYAKSRTFHVYPSDF